MLNRVMAGFVGLVVAGCVGAMAAPQREGTVLPLERLTVIEGARSIHLWLTVFTVENYTVRVIDNGTANGGGGRYVDLGKAMTAERCVAGINGGFFDRSPFNPSGLMIVDGRKVGNFDPKSWYSGVLVIRAEGPALELSKTFQPDAPGIISALQSGPWLVRGGVSENDNNKTAQAERTFIGHDGKGRWVLGVTDGCTLQELANVLRAKQVTAVIDLQAALNFDGGPSTCLWLKGAQYDFYRRERWTVRNFVGVVPK